MKAFIFDLDGTLIDTEPLKNQAYVRVALELSRDGLQAAQVIAAATELIGVPAPETAMEMVQRLGLEQPARARMDELGASAPWEAFLRLDTAAYNQILDEPGVLQRAQFPHVVSLLYEVRRTGFKTGLATMSFRREAERVLDTLGWAGLFEAVVTGDEVQRGKPDPEVYLRVAEALALPPGQCVVIEDSPSGVAGALAAGMLCIAVPTDLTRAAVHQTWLDERWIVDDPGRLREAVAQLLAGAVESRG